MQKLAPTILLVLTLALPFKVPANTLIDNNRAVNAGNEPGNWLLHGRTYSEQRFSPLNQINETSVQRLGLAWYFETDLTRGHESTPIVVDGTLYLTTPWSRVAALNATDGSVLWRFNPAVPGRKGADACCDVVNRGVAVWRNRVYVATLDGRLIALDATSGKLLWEVATFDPTLPYTITGAPRVVEDKVIIGNGGAELGVRGFLTAYDAETGRQAWRFYSVPGDPELPFESDALKAAAKTWKGGDWWKIGGGGTMWDSMAYDPEAHLLYVGTGNGSPWNRWLRSPGGGDNLYLSSIVALNPDNGELVWYFQTTPGDTWDYTATQHMILADLMIGGKTRKVIMQAPKNGFFYVLDRLTGEFISGNNYVPVNWANGLDAKGRPVENPSRLYKDAAKRITPTAFGGHNWEPMTFSPQTGLAYIPTKIRSMVYSQDPDFEYQSARNGEWATGTGGLTPSPEDDLVDIETSYFITAWDPVRQRENWRAATGISGGLLSTAGNLVFGGDSEGVLRALAANDGEVKWQSFTERGILAPPISYAVDGVQYIAVLTGWGGVHGLKQGSTNPRVRNQESGRLLVFALGGKAELPEQFDEMDAPELPTLTGSAADIQEGETLFKDHCNRCHAFDRGGAISNLVDMASSSHRGFQQIVGDGIWESAGMIGFGNMLSSDEIEQIHQYIIHSAIELRATSPD